MSHNHKHDHDHHHHHDHDHDHHHHHHHDHDHGHDHDCSCSHDHAHSEHEEMMIQAALQSDKKDLIEVLKTRFGLEEIPANVMEKIDAIRELEVIDRVFLVAVNAASWDIFVKELIEGKESFKIIGEDFNPLSKIQKTK